MLKNLFGVSIYREVMKVLKEKISNAQKSYELEVQHLKSKKAFLRKEIIEDANLKLDELDSNHEMEMQNSKVRHINQILSKII